MRGAVLATAALLGGALLAACAGGGDAPAESNTQGVSAKQVVVGTTAPETGPASAGIGDVAAATRAYFDYANAHGGVHGRTIRDVIENDEGSSAKAVTLTNQLLNQTRIFADVGPLGDASLPGVSSALAAADAPAVFMGSGCTCWSSSSLPQTFGWEPSASAEGQILGQFDVQHYAGQKVAYLTAPGRVGLDGLGGLISQVPSQLLVVRNMSMPSVAPTSPAVLTPELSALMAAGVHVVMVNTTPGVTAGLLGQAAALGYHPQWILYSSAGDPQTLSSLMAATPSGANLLNGVIVASFLPPSSDASNGWVTSLRQILQQYDPGAPWDGATEYGLALGYSFVEALQQAGAGLTRTGLVSAIEREGTALQGAGLVPMHYSGESHLGYSGAQVGLVLGSGAQTSPLTPSLVLVAGGGIVPYSASPVTTPPATDP
jgi:ABC-type branched-subunit amino acid transport system substrate-binding protein